MKKLLIFMCVALILFFSACEKSDPAPEPCDLPSGMYYAVGDYEELMTPCLALNFDDYSFRWGAGSLISHQDYGNFTVKDGQIVVTNQNSNTYVFEIKDSRTVVCQGIEYVYQNKK